MNLLLLCQPGVLSIMVVSIQHVDSTSYLIKPIHILLIIKAMFYSIISLNDLSFPEVAKFFLLTTSQNK